MSSAVEDRALERKPAAPDGCEIAEAVAACFNSLGDVQQALEKPCSEEDLEHLKEAIQGFEGRFRIWSGNLGAHQRGKSSLDYRLRDAANIKSKLLKLLHGLEALFLEVSAICSGQRAAAEDDSDDSGSSDDESDTESDEGKHGEVDQIFEEIQESIDCLYRMSMNLRNVGGNRRYAKAAKIDVSYFESFDIQFMKQMFPLAEEYLCERLGKAISRRRQFLKYQEEHATKLARGVIPDDDQTVTQSETTASTIRPDPLSGAPGEAPREQAAYADADQESMISATSYATIPGVANSIKWPSLPKAAESASPYKCPYCHIFIEAHTTSEWRRHLVRDLQPYLCTFEKCILGSEMYEGRKLWWRHETQYHRQTWICVNHCQREFSSKTDFAKHMKRFLPSLTDDQIETFSHVCARSFGVDASVECPLCKEKQKGSLRLGKHIARHLEEIALRALPAVTTEDDEEIDDDSQPDSTDEGSLELQGETKHNEFIVPLEPTDEDQQTSQGDGKDDKFVHPRVEGQPVEGGHIIPLAADSVKFLVEMVPDELQRIEERHRVKFLTSKDPDGNIEGHITIMGKPAMDMRVLSQIKKDLGWGLFAKPQRDHSRPVTDQSGTTQAEPAAQFLSESDLLLDADSHENSELVSSRPCNKAQNTFSSTHESRREERRTAEGEIAERDFNRRETQRQMELDRLDREIEVLQAQLKQRRQHQQAGDTAPPSSYGTHNSGFSTTDPSRATPPGPRSFGRNPTVESGSETDDSPKEQHGKLQDQRNAGPRLDDSDAQKVEESGIDERNQPSLATISSETRQDRSKLEVSTSGRSPTGDSLPQRSLPKLQTDSGRPKSPRSSQYSFSSSERTNIRDVPRRHQAGSPPLADDSKAAFKSHDDSTSFSHRFNPHDHVDEQGSSTRGYRRSLRGMSSDTYIDKKQAKTMRNAQLAADYIQRSRGNPSAEDDDRRTSFSEPTKKYSKYPRDVSPDEETHTEEIHNVQTAADYILKSLGKPSADDPRRQPFSGTIHEHQKSYSSGSDVSFEKGPSRRHLELAADHIRRGPGKTREYENTVPAPRRPVLNRSATMERGVPDIVDPPRRTRSRHGVVSSANSSAATPSTAESISLPRATTVEASPENRPTLRRAETMPLAPQSSGHTRSKSSKLRSTERDDPGYSSPSFPEASGSTKQHIGRKREREHQHEVERLLEIERAHEAGRAYRARSWRAYDDRCDVYPQASSSKKAAPPHNHKENDCTAMDDTSASHATRRWKAAAAKIEQNSRAKEHSDQSNAAMDDTSSNERIRRRRAAARKVVFGDLSESDQEHDYFSVRRSKPGIDTQPSTMVRDRTMRHKAFEAWTGMAGGIDREKSRILERGG